MLFVIAESADAILIPAVDSATGVIVWKVIPRIAVGAIIFAHGAPLPLRQVRPKALPVFLALDGLLEPPGFFNPLLLDCHAFLIVEQQLETEGSRFPPLSYSGKQFANPMWT